MAVSQARNSGSIAWKIVIVVLRSSQIMDIFWRQSRIWFTVLMWDIRVKRWEMVDFRALARVTRKTMLQCTDMIKAMGRGGFRENILGKSLTDCRFFFFSIFRCNEFSQKSRELSCSPFYCLRLGFSQLWSYIHLEQVIQPDQLFPALRCGVCSDWL